jgi:hypothetical protein
LDCVSFENKSTGQTYQMTQRYASSLSSAEWVVEAPSGVRGRLLPLDDFGTITFIDATAIRNGLSVTIGDAGGQAITLTSRRGQALAEPSGLGADGASFNVSRTAAPAFGGLRGSVP